MGRQERGQATVEVAFVLPVVLLLVLAVLQVGLVARDQVLVTHAAREAARAVAVDGRPASAVRAARASGPLAGGRIRVEVRGGGGEGSTVTVVVRYRSRTDTPLVGGLVGDVDLVATAAMRVETGPDG